MIFVRFFKAFNELFTSNDDLNHVRANSNSISQVSTVPSALTDDVVNFSAYAPPIVSPSEEFAINVYAYLDEQFDMMNKIATQSGDVSKSTKAGLVVKRNSQLTFILLPHEHFNCEENSQSLLWYFSL